MELFQVIYALTTIALLLLFIKVIPYWFNSFDSIFRVINVYVFATIIIDLFGILEFVLNRLILNDIFFRMSSVFKDPNIYARFNLIAIFFLLSILFFQKNLTKNHKVYYSSALILTIVCVFLSLSRSGYLTFVLGLIVFSFLFKGKQYKIIVIGIVSLFTIIGVLLLATQRDFFGGTAVVETSGINRIQLILGGIRIIKDNWLLGIGYSNFGNFYITTYVSKILKTTEFTYYMMGYATSIHNWLIEVWVEQGIIGLLAFIFLFSNILKYLFSTFKKESDPLKRVCLSSFYLMTCVFLIHGFFYHTFIFHFFFWLMFSFAVSLITLLTK
jgi:O-antigen ligase